MLMSPPSTIEILNRLLVLHVRSLPMYLSYAPPYQLYQHENAKAVLDQIVDDQKRTIDRLGTLILDSSGTIDYGEFPMSFTSLHDLSLAYLLTLLIDRQQKTITACEKLADALSMAPYAQAAAREAVGEAKGHLENLQELQASLN
ncbi:MAG TPA: hypothetical protein VGI40_18900 [Pirellulaceae bacterium]